MSANSRPSHYAVLGLNSRDFDTTLLKKQYRALALRWHPDRNHGNEKAAEEKEKALVKVRRAGPAVRCIALWSPRSLARCLLC